MTMHPTEEIAYLNRIAEALTARVKELEAVLKRIAADDEADADLNEWGAAAVARAALSQPAQPAIRTDSRYNNAERIFGDD